MAAELLSSLGKDHIGPTGLESRYEMQWSCHSLSCSDNSASFNWTEGIVFPFLTWSSFRWCSLIYSLLFPTFDCVGNVSSYKYQWLFASPLWREGVFSIPIFSVKEN
jgi:hypothetical protein